MKNLPLLLGTLAVTAALIFGVVSSFSNNGTQQEPAEQSELMTDSPHVKGAEDAVVTIVEFSDFQCPACRATNPLVEKVVNQYSEQVRLVFRHFPLSSIHPNALLAAQAAEVAAEEGKFWEYHDLLFKQQLTWSQLDKKEVYLKQLASYAEELGIDKGSFLERIESDHIKSLVTEDLIAGGRLNINATPTLYVNGQPTPASQLMQMVESIINN